MATLAGGRVLQLREWAGRGDPVVLLPGMLDSASGWNELAQAGDRRYVAVDLPGFGRSSLPTRARLSAYAEDVVHMLRQSGVRSFTLVGHSLGGGVATAIAERMPREVTSLVLCAPVGFGRVALAELAALPVVREMATGLAPRVLASPHLLGRLYATFVTHGAAPTDELLIRLAADADRVGPGFRAAVEAVAAAGRSPRAFYHRLVRYDGPVTAAWGDRDVIVPSSHRHGVAAALPQADVRIWSGMGHHPQRERLHELAELVAAVPEGRMPRSFGAAATRPAAQAEDRPARSAVACLRPVPAG